MAAEVVALPRGERPLEGGDGVVLRFARDLRLLREKAGRPTYRELGGRAHYSAAALSEAAGGRKLPTLSVTVAYVAACGGDTAEWATRWRAVAAELAATNTEPSDTNDEAPYLGLAAFEREDADRFFGRDELVADLVKKVTRHRFLGVFGPSGCGKSSVLRAGLAAHLAAGREEDDPPVVVFTPGERPFEECAVRLARFLGEAPGVLREEFSEDPRNLHLRIRQAVVDTAAETDVVLIVDQFEELFTLCGDESQRGRFIDALVTAATDPAGRARVVLGVRADFLEHCGRHHRLVSTLYDAQVLVGPMSTDELRRAIVGPAEQAGYRLETALVARLVGDATRQAGMLPLVSHALLQTWLRRQGAVMTVAGYEAAGGIEHALARSAEQTYQALDTSQQHIAQRIFLRLTALGEGTEDTKRRTAREEFGIGDPDTVVVLDTLARARLITLGDDSVEIAHEALIRHWPRLRTWLADDRDGHRIHRRLTEAAAEWDRHERDAGLLYRGARLDTWEERPTSPLNDLERAFLDAGRDAVERERRARRRRVRFTVGGLSTATVIVTVLAVVALVMAARADDQRKLAVGRQLVTDARAQLQVDPELGLLLAREAYRTAPSEDTEAVLRQATIGSHIRTTLSRGGSSGAVFSQDGKHVLTSDFDGTLQVRTWDTEHGAGATTQTLRADGSPLSSPVFSSDGRRIAAVGFEGLWVWDWGQVLAGGAQPMLLRRSVDLPSQRGRIALSSDGRRVASANHDGTVRIWNAAGDDHPAVLRGHDGHVFDVAFSRDGRWLASAGEDGTVRLWNLADGGSPAVFRGHEGAVDAVAFSPDGRHLASAGADGTVRVWDLARTADAVVLGRHDGGAFDVAYSPDGHSIASAGHDGTVKIWNADLAAEPLVLRGHLGSVGSVAFSPDGHSVASADNDGTVKIWDLDEVVDLTVLRGQRGRAVSVAAGQDGRVVVSGGQDGTVCLWDVSVSRAPILLAGNTKPVVHVAISPTGRQVAAVHEDGTVDIWKTGQPAAPIRLREPSSGSLVVRLAFNADGNRLAGVAEAYIAYVWNTPESSSAQPVPETVLIGGAASWSTLRSGWWSPDGRRFATLDGGRILLWDLEARGSLTALPRDVRRPRTLAFSRDGAHLAVGSDDGTLHLWNVADMAKSAGPVALHGRHQDAVRGVTFSQDGRLLVTVGLDATVRFWETADASEPLVLSGFRAAASTVASLADGRYVTTHDDGTIRIWRCPACGSITEVLAQANRHITRELTSEERRRYLPSSET
ncbi:hypothetical protein AB0J55_21860 [Amycolatopsis sp. NPDC049688]|uniref:nSTAND1 domain-containing NTPase n=1 Tax=Amycolatopsis sp. NPDC049688 TaxID=3154733 RepID=UPI00342C9CFD